MAAACALAIFNGSLFLFYVCRGLWTAADAFSQVKTKKRRFYCNNQALLPYNFPSCHVILIAYPHTLRDTPSNHLWRNLFHDTAFAANYLPGLYQLGLPDSLLGSAWPTMYPQLGVPFSYAGILSMIISLGTIVSSLNSDRLTRALGTGRVTALSVGMTAAALFGFSVSGRFWMLCLWAVPYGLGAGSVDAALNNYVALHYESRHMSWLHCMWGVGTTIGLW